MSIRFGRRFWIGATALIVVFSVFVIGRNLLHAVKIKRQIAALTEDRDAYLERIEQDSLLLEHLRYDDYLIEFARETFHMRRSDEHVYILKE